MKRPQSIAFRKAHRKYQLRRTIRQAFAAIALAVAATAALAVVLSVFESL